MVVCLQTILATWKINSTHSNGRTSRTVCGLDSRFLYICAFSLRLGKILQYMYFIFEQHCFSLHLQLIIDLCKHVCSFNLCLLVLFCWIFFFNRYCKNPPDMEEFWPDDITWWPVSMFHDCCFLAFFGTGVNTLCGHCGACVFGNQLIKKIEASGCSSWLYSVLWVTFTALTLFYGDSKWSISWLA